MSNRVHSLLKTVLILTLFLMIGCDSDSTSNFAGSGYGNSGRSSTEWLVPTDQIVDGGVGRDGIPSIDSPRFTVASKIDFMEPEDRIIGVKYGNHIKAYPVNILDYHEVVNDRIRDLPFCLTYCPLTGTGIAWNREINGTVTTFGVSGLIYKNNLIPYDRETGSFWSQMLIKSVNGDHIGHKPELVNLVETNWKTWKKAYPNSDILSQHTGSSRDYSVAAYGDYGSNNELIIFPVLNWDERLPNKAWVHGIRKDTSYVVYPFRNFNDTTTVLNDQVGEKKVVIFGNKEYSIIESYSRTLPDGTTLTFEAVQDSLPVVMKDQQGNRWNLFGEAASGPLKGTQLEVITSYNGYWFAFVDFWPNLKIRRP